MPATGIPGTSEIPFGSHLCLFYRWPTEFLQVTAAFLKAGLANNELGVWVLPPSLTISSALEELSHHGLDGLMLQATKQLHVLSAHNWFSGDTFNVEGSLKQLSALPAMAHQHGYSSVRAVGGPGAFQSETARQAFIKYEHQATNIIAALPCIGLCCYASTECLETDMFEIMDAHPQTLLRTQGGWASM